MLTDDSAFDYWLQAGQSDERRRYNYWLLMVKQRCNQFMIQSANYRLTEIQGTVQVNYYRSEQEITDTRNAGVQKIDS